MTHTHTHTHACAYMQRNVWLSHQVTSTTDYAGLLADLSGQVGFPTKSLCLGPMNLSDSGFKVSLDAFSSKRRATKVLFSWCWLRDVEGCRGTKGIDIGHHKLIIVDIHSERCWEAKQLSCWAAKSWLGGITLEKRFPVVTFFGVFAKTLDLRSHACRLEASLMWKWCQCLGTRSVVWTTYDPLIIMMDQHFPCRHVPACLATIRSELPLSPKALWVDW